MIYSNESSGVKMNFFRLIILSFFSITLTCSFSFAEVDQFEGLLDSSEYPRKLMYSIEYQHQMPQVICRDYSETDCDDYTTTYLYPYHTWQDRVNKTYEYYKSDYEEFSEMGSTTITAIYMGTHSLSYDVALYDYDSKTISSLTYFKFNGADMLALQISYITNFIGNFLNYTAYLIGNDGIGFLDSIYFIFHAVFSVIFGLIFWLIGLFATIIQVLIQPLDSLNSITDLDYWKLLINSLVNAFNGLFSGLWNILKSVTIELIDLLWTTIKLIVWMTLGLNLFDGLVNIVVTSFIEVKDLIIGIFSHLTFYVVNVLHVATFGYVPMMKGQSF